MEIRFEDKTLRLDGNGRVGRMIRFLAEEAERIDGPERVQVTFNCAGKGFNVELKERLVVNMWYPR